MAESDGKKTKEAPSVRHHGEIARIERVVCGALFSENFSSGVLDERLWTVVRRDPGLNVAAREEQLRLWGTTTEGHGLHTAGVASRPFAETDVVAVASIRPASGLLETSDGAEGYHLQLNGPVLDHYYQVSFGRSREGASGWFARYVDETGKLKLDEPRVERLMNEEFIYVDIIIEHEAVSGYARGWIAAGEGHERRMIPVGSRRVVAMAAASVEVSLTTTLDGVQRDMQVRSARMYRRKENAPLVCSVTLTSGAALENAVVQLTAPDGKTMIGQGTTGSNGIARIVLKSKPLTLFPVPVIFKILRQAREVARAAVRSMDGEGGVYPGDVWAVVLTDEPPPTAPTVRPES